MRYTAAPEIAAYRARQYPKNTDLALLELHCRGLDTPQRRVQQFAKSPTRNVRIVGKARLWFEEDIDSFASLLEAEGRLTPEAQACKDKGVSFASVVLARSTQVGPRGS